MKRLWAPWRGKYIVSFADKKPTEGCIFCDLPAEGAQRQRDNLIVSCGERALLMLNRFPYNNGHLMVVPRVHVADPSDLSAGDYAILTELLRRTTRALREVLDPDGINLGMNLGRTAGAGIDQHCHYHLVPRWDGDTNFMPVIGQTKVLSVGIEQSYDQFLPVMGQLAQQVEEALG